MSKTYGSKYLANYLKQKESTIMRLIKLKKQLRLLKDKEERLKSFVLELKSTEDRLAQQESQIIDHLNSLKKQEISLENMEVDFLGIDKEYAFIDTELREKLARFRKEEKDWNIKLDSRK